MTALSRLPLLACTRLDAAAPSIGIEYVSSEGEHRISVQFCEWQPADPYILFGSEKVLRATAYVDFSEGEVLRVGHIETFDADYVIAKARAFLEARKDQA